MLLTNIALIYHGWRLDWPNAILGGLVGLALVWIVDWIKRPKITFLGFEKVQTNIGTLYKIKIKITGVVHPGLSRIDISWGTGSVTAKWDESPNPIDEDNEDKFRPELVQNTFYCNTESGKTYNIPVIHESEDGKLTMFSGWWFGKDKGYAASVPELNGFSILRFNFLSQNANKKSREFTVSEIIRNT